MRWSAPNRKLIKGSHYAQSHLQICPQENLRKIWGSHGFVQHIYRNFKKKFCVPTKSSVTFLCNKTFLKLLSKENRFDRGFWRHERIAILLLDLILIYKRTILGIFNVVPGFVLFQFVIHYVGYVNAFSGFFKVHIQTKKLANLCDNLRI